MKGWYGFLAVLGGACAAPAATEEAPPPLSVAAPLSAFTPAAAVEHAIGVSVDGRPLLASSRGGGPARVYLIGGIHGDEREGAGAVADLHELLRGGELSSSWRILHDVNPDGSARRRRTNARGVDLNRNWPASNFQPGASRGLHALSEPETAALLADLHDFAPDLVLVVHAARNGPFVNFDGPGRPWAELFAAAARSRDERWQVVADVGYPTPGSIGSYLGVDLGVPVLTVEFLRGENSEMQRRAALAAFQEIDRALSAPELVRNSKDAAADQENWGTAGRPPAHGWPVSGE